MRFTDGNQLLSDPDALTFNRMNVLKRNQARFMDPAKQGFGPAIPQCC